MTFDHIETWVFDLDNTLYPPEVRLFDQIETKMTSWVMETLKLDQPEANALRKHYWATYGTTLAGLMDVHGLDPGPYLTDVHDISFDDLDPDPALIKGISALPGRKIIYTNGTADYAANVADARGIVHLFDAIYGVEEANFRPKPEPAAYAAVIAKDGLTPSRSAMFEDDPRNLLSPKSLGMTTIHVAPEKIPDAHIDHHTDDLPQFLSSITQPKSGA